MSILSLKFGCDSWNQFGRICQKFKYDFRENKDFKVVQPAIILSNENYKIIQIKKNLDVYSGLKKE